MKSNLSKDFQSFLENVLEPWESLHDLSLASFFEFNQLEVLSGIRSPKNVLKEPHGVFHGREIEGARLPGLANASTN